MNKPKNIPYEEARDGNLAFWEEVTPVHLKAYGVDRFLQGERWLPNQILEEVGNVKGLSLLHLQCHFGLDSLAWVRNGAEVTGVDFSPISINEARELSQRAGLPAKFVCSDIYDLPNKLDDKFDVVFTSVGVLCWLKDLDEWARIVAHYLKPGGFFYIMDGHPLHYTFDDEGNWTFQLSYFHNPSPYVWEGENTDYMDPTYTTKSSTYEWQWSISDIVNAVIKAGLRIEFFNEFGALADPVYPEMVEIGEGLYSFPGMPVEMPILFSLKASKEN